MRQFCYCTVLLASVDPYILNYYLYENLDEYYYFLPPIAFLCITNILFVSSSQTVGETCPFCSTILPACLVFTVVTDSQYTDGIGCSVCRLHKVKLYILNSEIVTVC